MKIILMRHGRPVIDLEVMKNLRKSPAEVGQMVDDYLDVELDKIQNVPLGLCQHLCQWYR